MSERLHLGGMLQFDRSGPEADGAGKSGEIAGNGWMVGAYFAMRDVAQPLYFEGRLLYGHAKNEIDAVVLSEGVMPRNASFGSERRLAQARVEGMYRFDGCATLIPLTEFSHARDAMEPFKESGDSLVAGQAVAVSKLQIGAELEIPVGTARGELRFRLACGSWPPTRTAAHGPWLKKGMSDCVLGGK